MPPVRIVFYQDDDGSVPVLDWLRNLWKRQRKAYAKCYAWMYELGDKGYELCRPLADYLEDGIYELRVRYGHVNYRILYFYHRDQVCVLAHGLVKEDKVPAKDIKIARDRRERFEKDPERHTYGRTIEETQND